MARFPELDVHTLTPEQKQVYDTIAAGPRGGVRGPLAVWLRRPMLAQWAQGLGEYCRYNSSIEKRLSELAILVTARLWGSEYEWFAHEPQARAAGVPEEFIEAIRTNGVPRFEREDDAVVYDIATTLNRTRKLPDSLYQKGLKLLGEGKLVDLIGILGYYTLISMTINAFEVEAPPGSPKRL
jgi:4-carboxymuconolactone decarboxylase